MPYDRAWAAAEARRLAPLLEGQYAVVVSGPDSVAAAAVALELARVHGATRRVALADLVGDVAPLHDAIGAGPDDDPHGIADSFLYGVSLNKIARPIDETGGVFVMPSGTESVALEAVYRNERWRRLAAGFQQVGALLLIVAVRDVPGFDALCQYVGTLLPVGEATAPSLREVRVLWMAPPPPAPEAVRKVERARNEAAVNAGQRLSRLLASLAAAAALVLVVLWSWPTLQARFLPTSPIASADGTAADSAAATIDSAPAPVGAAADSSPVIVAAAPPLAPGDTGPATTRNGPLLIANPADSALAAAFAVYFVAANTVEEARPPEMTPALSAVAVSPVRLAGDGGRWFRVTVGAGADSAQATALLTRLRTAGQIGATSGSIIRVPFAFRLEQGLPVDSATTAIGRWRARGVRAYALRQTDGSVTLFTGAFQTPAQATLLADSLQGAGIPPTLVYRTGRTF
jgi:hypothetical protein